MKALNNLFGKNSAAKNISEFALFSMSEFQMNAIKGGTEPITEYTPTTITVKAKDM